jgi:hypothetical protein
MKLNSRKRSNQIRVIHRYLGFFLAGIMFMYALSGITLTYRTTDTFKKEVFVEKTIEKGLEQPPQMRGTKDINYNKETGEISYIQMEPPKLLGMMEKMHKATSNSPLFFLNVFFGVALLFFVFSAYWMFLPQTDIFKKAIYFTLGGMVLSVIMILI